MVLYAGMHEYDDLLRTLEDEFSVQETINASEAVDNNLLSQAEVFIIGPAEKHPIQEIQKIYAADKLLAVVVLAGMPEVKQLKQSIQFSPFIGSNTNIVTLGPELDIKSICRNAVMRTRQKRSFKQINISRHAGRPHHEKMKLSQMGSFLEYAPVGALLINENFEVVNYNRQIKRMFPALQFLNVHIRHIFSRTETASLQNFIQSDHEKEEKFRLSIHKKIVDITATDIFNEDGKRFFLLLIMDVSNESLEAQRIQNILEGLPQMAWTADPEGLVNYLTQGWYFYTGQSKQDATGSGWTRALHPEDLQKITDYWSISIATGKPFQQAARYRNARGDYRWHLARATAIRNPEQEIIMWVGTCTDIHDQILLTEELERKVKERTQTLQSINNELEQFAHITSHDLQEPLRKIRTFAGLLKERAEEELDEQSKKYVDKISGTAERMSDSLNALLSYTRLHKNEKFTDVDLGDIIHHAMQDLELVIAQKQAIITYNDLPVIKAIPVQMQQLFYNLLNNALKFSKPGVPPFVRISCRQIMEEELAALPQLARFKAYYEISVSDNGIGFEQKYADKIFTIFQRLHHRNEYAGTGIGLSLVKKVVANHNGEIHVKSAPGEGTTFHIILPLNPET